ncbi:uncharacterized protein BDZ83DRAFT_213395 [Colletotrichum acutatum]|uniref:Uncharacterized protein n=1 Tax=Glomerella acutata TaxID=27357 RepID=A0AAD8UUK0_GLOAC|nr:uncharacterized protein BDZ83DRAFT_213395 [Colletotrichum acutatum]KAK1727359.1 hypothetical protein BDZ83DRAFT_213395 [Colletotrichum acutatum]
MCNLELRPHNANIETEKMGDTSHRLDMDSQGQPGIGHLSCNRLLACPLWTRELEGILVQAFLPHEALSQRGPAHLERGNGREEYSQRHHAIFLCLRLGFSFSFPFNAVHLRMSLPQRIWSPKESRRG